MDFVFSRKKIILASDKKSVLLILLSFYIYFLANIPFLISNYSVELLIYFIIFLLYSLNVFFHKKEITIRGNCIINVIFVNYIICPISLLVLPRTVLILIPFISVGIPLFILLKNTKTQIIFGFLNILYKTIIIYFYISKFDVTLNVDPNIFIYEIVLLTVYYYFILTFLKTFSKQIKQTSHKLSTLVSVDDLTKLYNRRYLNKLLKVKTRACALSLADIDFFKRVNDLYGHQVGDLVLVKVSEVFLSFQYSRLSIVRFGGDEFLFLLEEGTIAELASLMEIIRKKVESLDFSINFDEKITISCGVTQCDGTSSWDEILEKTDKALYKAKEEGRNRVCSIL